MPKEVVDQQLQKAAVGPSFGDVLSGILALFLCLLKRTKISEAVKFLVKACTDSDLSQISQPIPSKSISIKGRARLPRCLQGESGTIVLNPTMDGNQCIHLESKH